jgi:hypothetical protein
MALQQEIELDNGIVTNYHRIRAITKITDELTIIEINSYVSESKREQEKSTKKDGNETESINNCVDTRTICKEYNEKETISDIYDYLKTLDEFKGAKDC